MAMPFEKNCYLCYNEQYKIRKNTKETIAKISEVMAVLQAELAKAAEGNKAAAARARKATLELEKLGKEFRKQSIAELK